MMVFKLKFIFCYVIELTSVSETPRSITKMNEPAVPANQRAANWRRRVAEEGDDQPPEHLFEVISEGKGRLLVVPSCLPHRRAAPYSV